MRLTTWNVNGIRNPFGYAPWNTVRTFPAMFDILQADIVVMQELKIQRKDLRDDMVLLDGWDCYFSLPKHKKGYSGVGIYTRNAACAPIKAEEGLLGVLSPPGKETMYRDSPDGIGGYPTEKQIAELGVDPHLLDAEGRCVCLEFPAFVLFGVYSPANSNGLRDDFRYGFICALDCRIRNLVKAGKNVVLVGDLNVSRSEIDTASAVEDMRKEGITHEEYISTPNRRIFNQLIIGGDVVGEKDEGREEPILWDVVRERHPDRQGMFTHWEQKINARPGNYGSRIDFILASRDMINWISETDIQEGLMGSDHCPVYSVFKDVIPVMKQDGTSEEAHMLDVMSPAGTFDHGKRLQDWSVKTIPAFSAKLLPEFDKRRSIRDMFKRPNPPRSSSSTDTTNGDTLIQNDARPGQSLDTANGHAPIAALDEPVSSEQPPGKPATIQTSAASKRKASEAPVAKSVKRQKSNIQQPAPSKSGAINGQKSLKGFFAPKSTPAAALNRPRTSEEDIAQNADGGKSATNSPYTPNATEVNAATDGTVPSSQEPAGTTPARPSTAAERDISAPAKTDAPPPSPGSCSTDGSIHDPIEAKNKWSQLMSKPAAPVCEHGEPCKSMMTKKKGENQGRSFWMCARPLGPSGNKERGTQWRCPTFIWCSDAKKEA